jgi:hypothetical protein
MTGLVRSDITSRESPSFLTIDLVDLLLVKIAEARLSCGQPDGYPAESCGTARANHKLSETRRRSFFACSPYQQAQTQILQKDQPSACLYDATSANDF